jgi:hypothetical protein
MNFCLMLTIANAGNLKVHKMDVKSAFHQAPIMEEILVKQPECF